MADVNEILQFMFGTSNAQQAGRDIITINNITQTIKNIKKPEDIAIATEEIKSRYYALMKINNIINSIRVWNFALFVFMVVCFVSIGNITIKMVSLCISFMALCIFARANSKALPLEMDIQAYKDVLLEFIKIDIIERISEVQDNKPNQNE